MYLKRHIDNDLENWKKDGNRLPLIVKGARQTGKSESIRHFASKNYSNVIEINFVTNPEFRTITQFGYSADDIIKGISLVNPRFIFSPRHTLLFFDEIQAFPDITTSLKFFKIDQRYDVICSGSLLGISYKEISHISVGYKEEYMLYSMDFEEFLWAKGYTREWIDEIYAYVKEHRPFPSDMHSILTNLFFDYLITGGMPAVVSSYIESSSFSGILKIQSGIVSGYKDDITKYAEGLDKARILNVYNHVPVQLGKENKKFQISKVAHGARTADYFSAIEWLLDAGILFQCHCLNFPELPIKGNYIDTKYKLYFNDTGLLLSQLDEEVSLNLRVNRNLGVYKGAIFESILAESLVKQGKKLVYYKKEDSTLEEDFFVRTIQQLVPIEVKATNGTSKSLRTLIDSERYPDITWGIKFTGGNIGYENNILTLPYFCSFLLKRLLDDMNAAV